MNSKLKISISGIVILIILSICSLVFIHKSSEYKYEPFRDNNEAIKKYDAVSFNQSNETIIGLVLYYDERDIVVQYLDDWNNRIKKTFSRNGTTEYIDKRGDLVPSKSREYKIIGKGTWYHKIENLLGSQIIAIIFILNYLIITILVVLLFIFLGRVDYFINWE